MWELDCEESWAPKNWCFWTVVLEKTPESPLDSKEFQPVHSKGDQSWVFIGRTDAEAETPVLWPSHVKSWLNGKDSDAGRDWGQEEKGTTENEMAGWHHRLDGLEFVKAPGVGDGQGSLACCSPWSHKESDMTEQLNWTDTKIPFFSSLQICIWFSSYMFPQLLVLICTVTYDIRMNGKVWLFICPSTFECHEDRDFSIFRVACRAWSSVLTEWMSAVGINCGNLKTWISCFAKKCYQLLRFCMFLGIKYHFY